MKIFQKRSSGFTLVELIVVIAILGILAGIAVPVYSGYITKAHKAADNQLLAAVNTSFAAACAEVGLGSTDVTGASLTVKDKCITGVTVSGTSKAALLSYRPGENGVVMGNLSVHTVLLDAETAAARIGEAFARYFGENSEKELQYYGGAGNFAFNPERGVFEAYDNGAVRAVSYSYTDAAGTEYSGVLTINTDDLNNYLQSTFDELGSSGLTSAMDKLVSSALKNASALFEEDNSPGFNAFFNALGLTEPDTTEMSEEEKKAAKEKRALTKANALVLYVASKADGYDTQSLYNQLYKTGTLSNAANSVFEASSMYALMTGYVNSDYAQTVTTQNTEEVTLPIEYNGTEYNRIRDYYVAKYGDWNSDNVSDYTNDNGDKVYSIKADYTYDPASYYNQQTENMTSPVNVVEMYRNYFENDSNFTEYMEKQGKTDLEAFFSAMNMIDDNRSNYDLESVLSGGFSDGGVAEMLKSLTGK